MNKARAAHSLEDWFKLNQRDLPWRKTDDPYKIWVSEIMLQQTQVVTVIPYYERFIEQFPSVKALADSSLDRVLKLWEGLGYYARCRNLHRAAQQISDEGQGVVPDTLEGLMSLPGIGRSTAGAIMTFAYNQAHPLLDGNVVRVISRLYNVDTDATTGQTKRRLWEISSALLGEARDAWSFNQGLMELGATVCSRKNPQCQGCVLSDLCKAHLLGVAEERPVKPKRKKPPHYELVVTVLVNDGQFLVHRRPEEGLLGGLWEFPGERAREDESPWEALKRYLQVNLGVDEIKERFLGQVKHSFTHYRMTIHVYLVEAGSFNIKRLSGDWRWMTSPEIEAHPFGRAHQKVYSMLEDWGKSGGA
jgi:A/G-specific adenine glycosylase